MNYYRDHVFVIPEDDRDRQIADGFILHYAVKTAAIQVVPPAGGWSRVLDVFLEEYVPRLRKYPQAHVVMLIDYDGQFESRRAFFDAGVPEDLKPRVFVLGSSETPEKLKTALSNKTYEHIGDDLAADCNAGTAANWSHPHLSHHEAERDRLVAKVRPFLF